MLSFCLLILASLSLALAREDSAFEMFVNPVETFPSTFGVLEIFILFSVCLSVSFFGEDSDFKVILRAAEALLSVSSAAGSIVKFDGVIVAGFGSVCSI